MRYNPAVDTQSLYIHWPFCPYKCHFCPFVALASQDQFMEQYHQALCGEIEHFATEYTGIKALKTVFLGGGTPSTYPNDLLLDMFGILRRTFIFLPTCEISIEVNPGTVRPEQFVVWKEAGINRLSIGVQSLKDSVLTSLNRLQSHHDVFALLKSAPAHFDNISIDLILGLPGVTTDEWKALINEVVTWPITHISIYFLTIHEDTPLYFKVQTNRVTLPSDDEMVELYTWTVDRLAQMGLERYELSNFARPGYESRHNSVYWERVPYKGFGLGACSFDGKGRYQNVKNLGDYLKGVEQKSSITLFDEELTQEQVHLEVMMLGLRRKKGVSYDALIAYATEQQKQRIQEAVVRFKQDRLLVEDGGCLRLTTKGMVVENEIITQLSR